MRKNQYKRHRSFFTAQKAITLVIILCFLLVIGALIYSLTYNPEEHTKSTIENLSQDYYENYLYPSFSDADSFKNNPESVMEKYVKFGFPTVSLRQLLLYDNHKNEKYADELEKNCDKDQTIIKIFPEAPYGKTDYRIEYTYSCEF
ncbi:hypothetical protein J6S37_00975 [Candidatus Saccharibacteria bacterium]|nr:hypothetical protein [Candidatus Saccharibacteria bacterium]